MVLPLIQVLNRDGKRGLRYNFHAGQRSAWRSDKRIVAIIAGARSGKTSFGATWLHREMIRRGPGHYLVAAPNYPLLDKGAAPEIKYLFETILGLGRLMKSKPPVFEFSESGKLAMWGHKPDRDPLIFFGHADDPESLEAMTAKAAWLDECGQNKFRVGSYEAIRRRLSTDQGRILMTTTPYNLGWLRQLVHDEWLKARRNHPEIDLFRFDSTANPAFPKDEYEKAKASMPLWRFNMFYRGIFSKPAGLIYDAFDETKHKCRPFSLPDHWPRFIGLDFGGINTAAVFFAQELNHMKQPTGRFFAYKEYKKPSITVAEHIVNLMKGEPRIPYCVGGSKSEGSWRSEFANGGIVQDATVAGGWRKVHGLPVHGPSVADVEVGITRVYSALRRDEIVVFDDMVGLLDEMLNYSREVDEMGEPTEKIADKETYHYLDATRYIIGYLKKDAPGGTTMKSPDLRPGCPVVSPSVPGGGMQMRQPPPKRPQAPGSLGGGGFR